MGRAMEEWVGKLQLRGTRDARTHSFGISETDSAGGRGSFEAAPRSLARARTETEQFMRR